MRLAVLMLLVVLAGCQTSPQRTSTPTSRDGMTYSGGDGRSKDTAVVINAANDLEGTDAEYRWLREHCACKVKGQALITDSGHVYDLMTVVLPNSSQMQYYFDITKSFGKF